MAEGRMLKKRISQSHKFAALKTNNARLLYIMLIPHLDIKGRFEADPKIIKGIVIPLLNFSCQKIWEYEEDMHAVGLIKLYKVSSQWYLEATKFSDFQSLRSDHEAKSQCPDPTTGELRELVGTSKVKLSKVKESKDNKIYVIFEHWNLYKGQRNWKSHREVTPEIEEAITERLKKYSLEQLKSAITNYADILLSTQFVWSKNWTLREFLTRHRPDDRNELQIYRFLQNNFSPDDFKREAGCARDKTDRSHIRQEFTEKILTSEHDKLIEVRKDVHHKDKAFLIDELRPEINEEILAQNLKGGE